MPNGNWPVYLIAAKNGIQIFWNLYVPLKNLNRLYSAGTWMLLTLKLIWQTQSQIKPQNLSRAMLVLQMKKGRGLIISFPEDLLTPSGNSTQNLETTVGGVIGQMPVSGILVGELITSVSLLNYAPNYKILLFSQKWWVLTMHRSKWNWTNNFPCCQLSALNTSNRCIKKSSEGLRTKSF